MVLDWIKTSNRSSYLITVSGPDSNSSLLQETCCGLQHENVIQGSGSEVYIKFTTDQTLSYTGFSINYMLNGVPTSTIPGTFISPAAQIQPSTG